MTDFSHLNIPDQWNQYFTKYPQGYTILEALLNWVQQVNDMVDDQNALHTTWDSWATTNNATISDFVSNYDTNLQTKVSNTLTDWNNSGFLNFIINRAIQVGLDEANADIDNLQQSKVDKNGNEQITMAMLAPDVKTALTGGAVASLTSDGVNTSNMAEKSIIPQKTNFFQYKFQNLSYLSPAIITYDSVPQTPTVFNNGTAKFTFTAIDGVWLHLQNLIPNKQYGLFLNNTGWGYFKRYMADKTTVLQSLTDFATNPARQKYYVWFTPTETEMYIYLSNSGGSLTPTLDYWKLFQIDDINSITGYYDSNTNILNEVPTLGTSYVTKPLVGKIGNGIGDSITVGATNNNVSYVQFVSDLLGLTYNNEGVSGEEVGGAYSRIDAMPQNVDFITFFEGTNDFNAAEPLGSSTDPADVSYGTFYARYRAVIEKVLTKWVDKPFILITPLQRAYQLDDGNVKTMVNANGWTLKQYVDIIKALALEYGLPVIDLYSISGLSPFNITTYTNDGLHPNDIGHHRIAGIIAREIQKYIQ